MQHAETHGCPIAVPDQVCENDLAARVSEARRQSALDHHTHARLLCDEVIKNSPGHSDALECLGALGSPPPSACAVSAHLQDASHTPKLRQANVSPRAYTIAQLIQERPPLYKDATTAPVSVAIHHDVMSFIDRHAQPGWRTYETGAGASTVAFLIKGCRHTAVMPDTGAKELIESFLQAKGIQLGESEIILAESQWHLPFVAKSLREQLDIAVIDGEHAFPMPFIDYYYFAGMVKVGGYLVVDDVNLYTGEMLMKFLRFEPFWRTEAEFTPSSVVYRKVSPFVDRGWSAQVWPLVNGMYFPQWSWQCLPELVKQNIP